MANLANNFRHTTTVAELSMPKLNAEVLTGLGKRLAKLRNSAGYTQAEYSGGGVSCSA